VTSACDVIYKVNVNASHVTNDSIFTKVYNGCLLVYSLVSFLLLCKQICSHDLFTYFCYYECLISVYLLNIIFVLADNMSDNFYVIQDTMFKNFKGVNVINSITVGWDLSPKTIKNQINVCMSTWKFIANAFQWFSKVLTPIITFSVFWFLWKLLQRRIFLKEIWSECQ